MTDTKAPPPQLQEITQNSTVKTKYFQDTIWGKISHSIFPYLLIAPTFIFIVAFTIWPTINAAIQSTIKPPRTVRQQAEFVGFKNYLDLFDENTVIGQSDNFPRVFSNTLVFVAVTVPVCLLLAFVMALLLNHKLKASAFYRSSIFYPVLLPLISAASIWAFLFADNFGLINTFLRWVGLNPIGWTRDAAWALPAIMLVVIWKQTGYYMVFYLAGLQNLPSDIYEAAQLDGASAWQRLVSLTIPLLNGTTLFVLVIAGTAAFQTADPLYVLGQGQPNNRSNLILFYIYQRFLEPRDQGYVYAMTILLLVMLLVFTIANFLFLDRRANYE